MKQDGSVTVSFKVAFKRGPHGQRRAVEPKTTPVERPVIDPASVPRITRMLVLGYHFERLVRDGNVRNYAEIARMTGISRARVTQIVTLTLLLPETQSGILMACPIGPVIRKSASCGADPRGRAAHHGTW